ncbi:MAG: FKBP-type peptidyl-prolyl cis-trans isomerase, partial [Nitrospiraceae bacterium]
MQGLRVIVYFLGILLLSVAISVSTPYAEKRGRVKTPSVSQGKTVFMEYTFKLDDNTVVESSVEGKPFSFVPGERQIVPGLEK